MHLKVPKCEIFDLFDGNDFYVIKSLWVGDLKVPKREIFDRSDFPYFYTIKSTYRRLRG